VNRSNNPEKAKTTGVGRQTSRTWMRKKKSRGKKGAHLKKGETLLRRRGHRTENAPRNKAANMSDRGESSALRGKRGITDKKGGVFPNKEDADKSIWKKVLGSGPMKKKFGPASRETYFLRRGGRRIKKLTVEREKKKQGAETGEEWNICGWSGSEGEGPGKEGLGKGAEEGETGQQNGGRGKNGKSRTFRRAYNVKIKFPTENTRGEGKRWAELYA